MTKTTLLMALAASAAMAAIPSLAAAQYGQGSSQRSYSQEQDAYQERLRDYNAEQAAYEQRNGPRRYDRRAYAARGYDATCDQSSSGRTTTGGIIGALAGAAVGSNVAGRGSRTEGAVLGAFAGGVLGAGIAHSSARCDSNGYYYAYNQTSPYREPVSYRGQQSGQHDYNYYRHSRCRLVIAPAQWGDRNEPRYARVCPDRSGRYRLTD